VSWTRQDPGFKQDLSIIGAPCEPARARRMQAVVVTGALKFKRR
jgi:hypothetical protein